MRLKKIEQVLPDAPVLDVVRTLSYQPELFGRTFSHILHDLLRGPSYWSIGERELFASFVSNKNQCAF